MEFIGNIDVNNLDLLEKASLISGIAYEEGTYATSTTNGSVVCNFRPFFCGTRTEGIKLLKQYMALANEIDLPEKFKNDLFVISSVELSKS